METETMSRDEFLEIMGKLWDSKNINIRFNRPRSGYGESKAAMELRVAAVKLVKELIKKGVKPFNKDLVCSKDVISEVDGFKFFTPTQIGRILADAGCGFAGQLRDVNGSGVRVWCVRRFGEYNALPARLKTRIFNGEITYEELHGDNSD